MDFADRLREYVAIYHESYEEFGAVVGLSKNEVSNYINRYRKPGADNLAAFAKAGINVQWLLTGEGPQRVLNEKASLQEHKQREEMLNEIEANIVQAEKLIQQMRRVV